MDTKTCIKCKEIFPLTIEHFGKLKSNKGGFSGKCKTCVADYKKEHYKRNEKAIKEYQKQWKQENKKSIAEYQKQYKKPNVSIGKYK